MAKFERTLLAEDGVAKIHSEALGDNTKQAKTFDVGQLVKMTANSYVACAAGDDIGGQISAVEVATVNDGFSYGAVKKSHRIKVQVASDQVSNMAVGDLVVAGAGNALGKTSEAFGQAKTGTPAIHNWQCIWVSGSGAVGDFAILERV